MTTRNVNLLWKDFKGIRKLNTVNSDTQLGADIAQGVRLSKEKSGQMRSIKSSGWFNEYLTLGENVIRLFSANLSGYPNPDQLIAFTKNATNINVWIIRDNQGLLDTPTKIAEFPLLTDVTDVRMTQFGDRLVVVVAFGSNQLGFIAYSGTALPDWLNMSDTSFYYRTVQVGEETTGGTAVSEITSVRPYRSRLAINGTTVYKDDAPESIYGVWFSEAGNPLNFTMNYLTEASETSAFFVETGEKINSLEEYHGLTAFGRNRSFNITGTSQNDGTTEPLTAIGVFGNATFTMNGQCAYVDSYAKNIFTLRDNIDGTIGFNDPIGNDIQDFLDDVNDVSVNSLGRRVRMTKSNGESLVLDVDIGEWTIESFKPNSRVVSFLNEELFCDGTPQIYQITDNWTPSSQQTPKQYGYYSHYRTNIMWLDSQTSVKSHIYPFAVILEPNTSNDFFIKFTVDRRHSYEARITRAGFENVATYSNNDNPSTAGSFFVESDDDLSGGTFFALSGNELLVTAENPPFWRYLQIDIYTTSPQMQFNISGIEAKNTFITDELLDY